MSNANNNQGELAIYACGGCGIGIGKYFEEERGKKTPGYAELFPVYIDTSSASKMDVPEEFFYKLPEAEGSGGVRSYNGRDIVRYTGEVLQKFPPKKHNVVIHSTTGGSGSVQGPSIVSELLSRGLDVIVFAIGGEDTLQYIINSIGTLDSYEGIVETRQAPVVLQYLQNGKDGTIEEIDSQVHLAISCLAVLYSGANKNLDDRDLHNVLNFSNKGVTSYAPQVGVLKIQQRGLDIGDSNLISVATLNEDLNNTSTGHPVEYQRVGVPVDVIAENAPVSFPLHFAVLDGFLDTVMKNLRRQRSEFESRRDARVVRNRLSEEGTTRASNGVSFD